MARVAAPIDGTPFWDKLCTLFHDEFVSVSLPRQLVIQNTRLGIMFKVLQVMFLSMMMFYCVNGEVWRRPALAQPWGFSAWTEGPRADAVPQPSAAHCTDSQSYHYNFSGQLQLMPSGCRALPAEEASTKMGSGGEVFITTFTQDRTTWLGSGSACGTAARQACEGSLVDGSYAASGGTCSCTSREEYFAQDPQDQQIFFSHGYEVDHSNGQGLYIIRGSSLSSRVQEGPKGRMSEHEEQLTTIFQKPDGSPCQVGGKSEWSSAASVSGISGTLREFLGCAGLDLDTSPRSLMSASGLAPHVRTMGLSMELHMRYQNSIFRPGVVCYVTVVVVPVWTWKQTTDFVRLPISGGQSAKQSRKVFGVAVNMKAAGQFYSFDFFKLVTAAASLLVMLQVPRWITQFVALYCLGLMSNIYRNAKRARLNIFEHFHGACARMMLAEIGFRGLMGGIWEGTVADMPGLTERQLHRQLRSIFHDHIENGILQPNELRKMANIIFTKMDVDKSGAISCADYVHSCTANDTIDLHSMARFFDDDKKVGFVQSYFDDTDEMRRDQVDQDLEEFNEDDTEEGGGSLSRAITPNRVSFLRAASSKQLESVLQARPAGLLEADDVRELVAQGLDVFDQRLNHLEKLCVESRFEELNRKVDAASTKAAQASAAAKANRIAMAKKEADYLDNQANIEHSSSVADLSVLSSRVQQMEDSIGRLQSTARATLRDDESLREALTRPTSARIPSSSSPGRLSPRDNSQAVPVHPTLGAEDVKLESLHPDFAKTLTSAGPGTPTLPPGDSSWSKVNRDAGEGAGESAGARSWRQIFSLN